MVLPDNMPMPYFPDPLGEKELNIGNQWRARWHASPDLPKNAPVAYGYAVVFANDRGYLARERGSEVWNTVEGALQAGEQPAAWVKRAVTEQVGASGGKTELLGYFQCKATSHNTEHPKDAVTVRPMYLVAATTMKDAPASDAWERRRLPMNEFAGALRGRYVELQLYLQEAVQRYAVWRAKGLV